VTAAIRRPPSGQIRSPVRRAGAATAAAVTASKEQWEDVPREDALEDAAKTIAGKEGTDQPYCTCRGTGGYRFDPQMGVYVHSSCYKPSKGYYDAAIAAGILEG